MSVIQVDELSAEDVEALRELAQEQIPADDPRAQEARMHGFYYFLGRLEALGHPAPDLENVPGIVYVLTVDDLAYVLTELVSTGVLSPDVSDETLERLFASARGHLDLPWHETLYYFLEAELA